MNFGEIILIKNLVDVPWMMNFIHFGDANTTEFGFIYNKVRKGDRPGVDNFDLSYWGVVVGMGEGIFGEKSGVEEGEGFRRAHSEDLEVASHIFHHDSIVELEIEVDETCLLSWFFIDFEIFLLPPLADPANISDGAGWLLTIVVGDDIDRMYPLNESGSYGDGRFKMLFFDGMQMPFKIDITLIPLIMQPIYRMVHFQSSAYFSGIELVYLAVWDIEMGEVLVGF